MYKFRKNLPLDTLEKYGFKRGFAKFNGGREVYLMRFIKAFYNVDVVIDCETRRLDVIKWQENMFGEVDRQYNFKGKNKYITPLLELGLLEIVF